MKQSHYFSHDSNARVDEKTLEMRAKFGLEGYGLYWCIIEMLSEATDYKLSLCRVNGISIAIPYDCHKLQEFIDSCIKEPIELFASDGICFWSESLLTRMLLKEEKRKRKSFAGKKGANSRWHNDSSVITDPMAKHGKVKESKVKESKVKKEPPFVLPDWIPTNLWKEFLKAQKKTKTPFAKTLAVAKLEKYREMKYDIEDIMKYSIEGPYPSFYEPKNSTVTIKQKLHTESIDREAKIAREKYQRERETIAELKKKSATSEQIKDVLKKAKEAMNK